MTLLTIYVPATEDRHGIIPGSGIVGAPADPFPIDESRPRSSLPYLKVDYEGGKYNPSYFADVNHRLLHAADRHTWQGRGYPTIARIWLPAHELLAVGTYDTDAWHIVEITNQAAFDAWNAQYEEVEK